MTDTVPEALYAQERPDLLPLVRIRRLALPFEIGFAVLAGLAALLIVTVLGLAYSPEAYVTFTEEGGLLTLDPSKAPVDGVRVASLPIVTQIVGLIAGLAISGSLVIALWSLHKLFGSYRRGEVFAEASTRLMRRAGIALVLNAALPGLLQLALRAIGSPDRNWFHPETIPILLIGAGLFIFSYIIALGAELLRENKGFI